jgi:PAS domain S-box-containing protein
VLVVGDRIPVSAGGRDRAAPLLSARERDVLRLAALGHTTGEIASLLWVAEPTVETYVRKAAARLGARNRAHAIALALASGEIDIARRAPPGEPARGAETASRRQRVGDLFALLPLPAAVVDAEGLVVELNSAFERGFGWTARELAGKSILDVIHAGDRAVARAAIARLTGGAEDERADVTVRMLHRDGRASWVAWSGARSRDGATLYGVGHPVAPDARADGVLGAEPAELLTAIASGAPAAVHVKDRQLRYVFAHPLLEEAFGVAPGGLAGRTDAEVLPAALADVLRAADERVLSEGQLVYTREVTGTGPERRQWLLARFPLRDATGAIGGLAGLTVEAT